MSLFFQSFLKNGLKFKVLLIKLVKSMKMFKLSSKRYLPGLLFISFSKKIFFKIINFHIQMFFSLDKILNDFYFIFCNKESKEQTSFFFELISLLKRYFTETSRLTYSKSAHFSHQNKPVVNHPCPGYFFRQRAFS